MIITIDGYIIPLVPKEGVMYLKFMGKPTDEDLGSHPLVHLTSVHKWDPTMLVAPNPCHSFPTDGGEQGSPTGTTAASQPIKLSTRIPNGLF